MASKRSRKRYDESENVVKFEKYEDRHQSSHRIVPQKKKNVSILPRGKNQSNYVNKLLDFSTNIVFAIGPAGSGKSMLACQTAVKMLKENQVDKIVVTRPAVSVDEEHGFLPGTLQEKMAPWTRPMFDVFQEYYYSYEINNMLKENVIEISPLAYMRGRTFKNAFIIADEIQLATISQVKMLLTRIGENSKMVITGDLAQADRGDHNGLFDFVQRIEAVDLSDRIAVCNFTRNDIERHPVVKEILEIYGDLD